MVGLTGKSLRGLGFANVNHSILPIEDAVEDIERTGVVGDNEDAGLPFGGDFGKKFHHLTTEGAVEGSGGFVCEDEAGVGEGDQSEKRLP